MNYLLAILLVAATANLEQTPPKTFVKPIQTFSNQENITYDELHDEALFDCPFSMHVLRILQNSDFATFDLTSGLGRTHVTEHKHYMFQQPILMY